MADVGMPMSESAPGPRSPTPDRWGVSRPWIWILLVLAGGFASALLFFHRPQGQFFYPRCSFYATTGWLCPGCGGLRATHELLHGNWAAAIRCNALFVVGAPVAGMAWLWLRRRTGRAPVISSRCVWWMFGAALVFTVLRNLSGTPFARWLAP